MNKWIFLTLGAAALIAADDRNKNAWWAHVEFLASDELEGRNTGSPGYRKAAGYVAAQFKSIGAKPAGTNGYFQPVKFRSRQIVEAESSLELLRGGKAEKLELGIDAYFGLRSEPDKFVEAPVVFVAYGLRIPELGIDDLAGLDLKGKIALVLGGLPAGVPATVGAHFRQGGAERLRAAGAIGVVSIGNPAKAERPFDRSAAARLLPSMSLADASLMDGAGLRLSVTFNPERAEKLFEGSGYTAARIYELDSARKPLPRFPLKVTLRARPVFRSEEVVSDNVVAAIPGTDPKLRSEYIVLSGHLDHVGATPAPVNGDRIYNGAMDNASGIASLIEVGRRLAAAPLKRSVLLLAVTGEEKGLLGSRYFSRRPTVPKSAIVANMNLDMFLPIIPLRAVTAYGIDESTLGDDFRAVAAEAGVRVQPDLEPHRVIFVRSDQYNFILQGIPALSFKVAPEPGTPDADVFKTWTRERYHGLSDDLEQPVNLETAASFNDLMLAMARRVGNRQERPRWAAGSFFSRFAVKNQAASF